MKKFKWIAQDGNGEIWKFKKKPELIGGMYKRYGAGAYELEQLSQPLDKPVTPIRINLKKSEYEIKDGILLKLPRDYYNKKTCDLMMRAWRLIIRSETGER